MIRYTLHPHLVCLFFSLPDRPYCSENHRTKYAVPTGSNAKIRCVVGAYPNDVTFRWFNPSVDGRVSVSIVRGLVESSDSYYSVSYQNVTVR